MGIVFGIGFAFGSGGAVLTSFGVGTAIFGANILFGQDGKLSVYKQKSVSCPSKKKSFPQRNRQERDNRYKQDKYGRQHQGEFFWPNDHFGRIDKRYK